ncbi:MAG: GGDEF domain-containing phosphodiesterase [Gammaproteobacteria bacterium]|nr:GGDEF domain-containing phosphodiesterase [Gammaproteobacteria bacterium]
MEALKLNKTGHLALEQEIDRLMQSGDTAFSVFMVDIGDVGKIFVKSGYAASRKVFSEIEKSLQNICRQQDRLCRVGDNKFCLLFSGVHKSGHIVLAAEKIGRTHSQAVERFDPSLGSMLRIGIVSDVEDGENAANLIHKASVALESARKTEQPYVVFSQTMAIRMAENWYLQEELAEAIDDSALELYYQPKFEIATRRPCGAEALLRWTSKKHGPVSPSVFVPLATEIGLMQELTRFVFTTGMRSAAEWPDTGSRLGLAVNLEATSLQHAETLDMLSNALSIWGGDNFDLTVEVTESTLVTDCDSNFERLSALRSAGIGISIDDFGTGYSSLSYFRNIPATELKIDQSFTSNMLESERDRRLVEAIIWLAHQFGMKVVAEGVQNSSEIKLLTAMKCDVIQGFYFSEALPHDEFCKWLSRYRTR